MESILCAGLANTSQLEGHMIDEIKAVLEGVFREVRYFQKELLEEAETDDRIEELFRGIQVLYSPVTVRPEVLIIGLNPGSGHFTHEGELVDKVMPLQEHEYFQIDATLANETREVFASIGETETLKKSVKTNYYYIATDSASTLSQLFRVLPNDLKQLVHKDAFKWTQRLVGAINPRVILCEGFMAFDLVSRAVSVENSEKNFGTNLKEIIGTNRTILGYRRVYSNITDKGGLAVALKGSLENCRKSNS